MDATPYRKRFWLTIVVPLVGSIVVLALVAAEVSRPTAIDRVADAVASLFEPGDLVIVYPETRFPDLERFDASVDAVAASTLPAEVERFQRVILVRSRGEMVPSLRRSLATRATLLYAEDIDEFTLELFQMSAPERVVLDLVTALPQATANLVERGEEPVPCPWSADRFDCGDAEWTWVGETAQTFEGQPHTCVWMHPVDDADVVVEFPSVAGTRVTGWFGLTDYAISIPDGSPVRMTLEAGNEVDRYRAHRQPGRRPVNFDLPRDYEGPLRIRVSATRAGVRHFCWNLQVVSRDAP